jgi:hypothetical protein
VWSCLRKKGNPNKPHAKSVPKNIGATLDVKSLPHNVPPGRAQSHPDLSLLIR